MIEKDEIYIIDNAISDKYSNLILDKLTEEQTEYFFIKEISRQGIIGNQNFGFAKPLKDSDYIYHGYYYLFEPMLHELYTNINKDLQYVLLSRAFMMTGSANVEVDLAHTDCTYGHDVILYYANDSDGDTILYNEFFDESINDENYTDPSNLTIFKKITPKKGRVVMFNGLRFHSSSRPSKNYRLVVNFNALSS